jgi:hypothetical protein
MAKKIHKIGERGDIRTVSTMYSSRNLWFHTGFFLLFMKTIHRKYSAPKQADMKKSMYLGPFQNKILFQNKFLFLFCPPFKYFSFTHFAMSK